MRSCGKRSFTLECKTVDRGLARRRGLKTGRPGFLLGRFFGLAEFFILWWRGIFSGVLGKKGVFAWCFCGEVVVSCW
jgi:hypothetical protein